MKTPDQWIETAVAFAEQDIEVTEHRRDALIRMYQDHQMSPHRAADRLVESVRKQEAKQRKQTVTTEQPEDPYPGDHRARALQLIERCEQAMALLEKSDEMSMEETNSIAIVMTANATLAQAHLAAAIPRAIQVGNARVEL